MTNTKHEDAVIKMGFNYFRDTILKALGINFQYEEIGPTELIELTIHSLYMDFMYILNFKQQIKKEVDLRRFHAYDAVYSNQTGKKVITYVIYSGGITDIKSELDCGLYNYRIQPIYLKDKNADDIFQKLIQKQSNNEKFTENDYVALSPLMSGNMSRKEMFKTAINLTKPSNELIAEKTRAILYALADKFLDKSDLDEIREVMRMTRLGQMLMDDGMEIKELENIKKLMKNTNWTIEQTMDMLEIPEEKRDKYRKTIVQNN